MVFSTKWLINLILFSTFISSLVVVHINPTNPYLMISFVFLSLFLILLDTRKKSLKILNPKTNWSYGSLITIYSSAALPLYLTTIIYSLNTLDGFLINLFVILGEILLFLISILNPLFIPLPYILNIFLIGQINIFGKLSLTDKLLPIAIITTIYLLVVFEKFILPYLKFKAKSLKLSRWLYTLSFVTACCYLAPAIAKLFLDNWIINSSIDQIYLSSIYQNGFNLFQDNTDKVASFLNKNSVLFLSLALLTELMPIIFVGFPRIFALCLINSSILHIVIFIFSGILFWKWIIVDLVLCFFLLNYYQKKIINYNDFFNKKFYRFLNSSLFGFSGILVLFYSGKYSLYPFLGWYDSSSTWKYEYIYENELGNKLSLRSKDFFPHSLEFAQGRFHDFFNLPEERILTGTYGARRKFISKKNLLKEWENAPNIYNINLLNKEEINLEFLSFLEDRPKIICRLKKPKTNSYPVFDHIWSGSSFNQKELISFCKNNENYNLKVYFKETLRLPYPKKDIERVYLLLDRTIFSKK